MTPDIPPEVLRADAERHRILEEIHFSSHLNPLNAAEARRAFVEGADAPPFTYRPLTAADAVLRRLDAAEPPRDHPLGALVGKLFDGTRLLVRALRDRTAAAFDALNRAAGWYPDDALLALDPDDDAEAEDQPLDLPAREVADRLRRALDERGLRHWVIEESTVMAARVLVDGAKRLVRIHPHARFRRRDLERLVVHEVEVHAVRTENGRGQPLRCFETGLPGSMATEEGLAMVAERRAGVASPGTLRRQREVIRGIELGRRAGFREVYEAIAERWGPGLAWGIALRTKRGLARPGEPGVYAKDSVYLAGWHRVERWLAAGGDPALLYVGKVGIDDPVAEWLAEGWITRRPVPETWLRAPAAR